jgi:hypothetical protein
MEDFENKSNNEILFAIKQMEADYESMPSSQNPR